MANEVLLVNPRKRRRARRKTAARRRPARRRAARRRNPIGPYARNPRRRPRRRRASPRRRRSGMGMYVANPRRRRRSARRRYRRNPTMRGIINQLVMPAATAGAGALALDVLWGYVPIPGNIKTGPMRHVAKGLGAIVMGWGVGKVASKKTGDTMALGALTVTFYNAFRELTAQFMPNIPLGYYSAGANAGYDPQLGYYVASPRLGVSRGESVPSANSELGYYVQEGVGQQY